MRADSIPMMHFFASVLLALSTIAGKAADPTVVVDISSGRLGDWVMEKDAKALEVLETEGGEVVVFSGGSVQLRGFEIKPATKYQLDLRASFDGDAESIEENPRFEFFNQPGHPNPRLPSHEIRFFDAEGEPVGRPLVHAHPFQGLRTYQDIFYSPHQAVTARIKLTSGKGLALRISDLKLAEAPDEGALNPNPGFELGLSNYSGWKNIADGGALIERDGEVILDTRYGSTGQMIPLTGPGTYGFSAKAIPNGYNSIVIVRVYDAEGNELMRTGSRKHGSTTYFVPPKEAVSASFLVYSCLLEEVRLFRAGDEEAITELRKK